MSVDLSGGLRKFKPDDRIDFSPGLIAVGDSTDVRSVRPSVDRLFDVAD